VLEIDLTLFSQSVELDTGEWELIGGSSRDSPVDGPPSPPGPPFPVARGGDLLRDSRASDRMKEEWRQYRAAFAEGSV
jgi:hypothetical protein